MSRASSGDLNNWPLVEAILRLRREQAQRLGYTNWAEVSLASKMADSVASVEQLLEELRSTDLVARVGGDEFVALVFNPDARGLHELVQRLQREPAPQPRQVPLPVVLTPDPSPAMGGAEVAAQAL